MLYALYVSAVFPFLESFFFLLFPFFPSSSAILPSTFLLYIYLFFLWFLSFSPYTFLCQHPPLKVVYNIYIGRERCIKRRSSRMRIIVKILQSLSSTKWTFKCEESSMLITTFNFIFIFCFDLKKKLCKTNEFAKEMILQKK